MSNRHEVSLASPRTEIASSDLQSSALRLDVFRCRPRGDLPFELGWINFFTFPEGSLTVPLERTMPTSWS